MSEGCARSVSQYSYSIFVPHAFFLSIVSLPTNPSMLPSLNFTSFPTYVICLCDGVFMQSRCSGRVWGRPVWTLLYGRRSSVAVSAACLFAPEPTTESVFLQHNVTRVWSKPIIDCIISEWCSVLGKQHPIFFEVLYLSERSTLSENPSVRKFLVFNTQLY